MEETNLPTFDSLSLSTPLQNALLDLGLMHPTPIQQKSFSVVLSGRDVVGIAQTGTGKTYAYLLPILRNLKFSKEKNPKVLIIVPTRELVVQIVNEVRKLTTYMTVRVEGVYGGTNINTQKILIENGLDILVGTPGRLLDLMLTRVLVMSSIRQLVIDEVDEMLTLGFRHQLTSLLDRLPRKRQNLLFSATMTEDVDELIQLFFNPPQYIEVTPVGTPLEKIHQTAYRVPNFFTKINLLEHLLNTDETMQKVLIFAPSKRYADLIHGRLQAKFQEQFEVIHSNKSQNFRLNAVVAFQKNKIRGLIATDLLARGLDVTDVTHVINIDTPDEPESYIHRIGRTGRADSEGAALTFIADNELERQEAIEAMMNQAIPMLEFPEEVEISGMMTEEERFPGQGKNYLKAPTLKNSQGSHQEKLAKNLKVNKGNKTLWLRLKKYKKPIKRRPKR